MGSDRRYGIFERCKELVEAGYDVRQPDKENVSLLHWAAINNRLDLVKQGHLPMVILLLQYGADPALIDGEGFCGIHLAVLFQHMPIIAYLISKGQAQIAFLGLTSYERTSLLKQSKHMKQTLSLRRTPYNPGGKLPGLVDALDFGESPSAFSPVASAESSDLIALEEV
ncbi:ZDHHC13, partial [Cervus elaphus hippelaphus]